MDRERLDKWCEFGILGLALGMLGFSTIDLGAVRPVGFLVVQGMACGILLLWAIRIWAGSKFRLLWPPVCWVVLAFVGYAVVRYRYSEIEYVARLELVRVVVYAIFFFAVLNNLNRQDFALALCVGVILVGSLESFQAIYQFATHSRVVWGITRPASYGDRVGGTFIDPNHLAGYLGMTIPAAVALVVAGRLGHAFKIVLVYLAGVMLIALCLTVSRGGVIAVGVSLTALLLILVRRRNYRLPAAFLLALLLGAGYFVATHNKSVEERFKELNRGGHVNEVRPAIWSAAWRMWLDYPWFGVGPGHFDYRLGQYRPEALLGRPRYAHNDYLNTLADWGATGGILVTAAFALFFWGVAKTLPFVHRAGNDFQAKKSNKPAVVLAGAAALLAMLIHAATEFNMQIPANALLAVAWLAVVSGYLRFATEKYWTSLRLAGKAAATALLLTVFAGLAVEGTVQGEACYWMAKAEKLPAGPARVPLLKRAISIEPANGEILYNLATNNMQIIESGGKGYEEATREAMAWFAQGIKVNPWEEDNYLAYGRCLDWIGQARQATPYFDRAVALDPNNYYVLAERGWHATYLGDYRQARRWYGRSLLLDTWRYPLAHVMYYDVLPRRIQEEEEAKATREKPKK